MKNPFFTILIFAALVFKIQAQTDDTQLVIEKPAQFPGGDRAFSIFWSREFHVPLKYRFNPPKTEGRVRFTVKKNGEIADARITQTLNPALDAAALAAVAKMPLWEPATQNGKAVESWYSFTFFVVGESSTQGFKVADSEGDSLIKKQGMTVSLYGGAMIFGGDFGEYFRPVRPVIGLGFGYRYRRLDFGFFYDIGAISKLQKPLIYKNLAFDKTNRFAPFHFYFPIGYWFPISKKWEILPFVAPSITLFEFQEKIGNSSRYEQAISGSYFSMSGGLRFEKIVGTRQFYNSRRDRNRYETTNIGLRAVVNFMSLKKENSTELRGPAVLLAASFTGWLQRER